MNTLLINYLLVFCSGTCTVRVIFPSDRIIQHYDWNFCICNKCDEDHVEYHPIAHNLGDVFGRALLPMLRVGLNYESILELGNWTKLKYNHTVQALLHLNKKQGEITEVVIQTHLDVVLYINSLPLLQLHLKLSA